MWLSFQWLPQVDGFLWVLLYPPPPPKKKKKKKKKKNKKKTYFHNETEILLKVALNNINQAKPIKPNGKYLDSWKMSMETENVPIMRFKATKCMYWGQITYLCLLAKCEIWSLHPHVPLLKLAPPHLSVLLKSCLPHHQVCC